MRTLLDLMCENEAAVQRMATLCAKLLEVERKKLTILDPEVGEEELIKSVSAQVARLFALSRSV